MAKNVKFPTMTKGIEYELSREATRRFKALKKDIRSFFTDNTFKVANYEYTMDSKAIQEFINFLQFKVDENIFLSSTDINKQFANRYIERSYLKGINDARRELRARGMEVPYTREELNAVMLQGGAIPTLGVASASPLLRPIHIEAIQVLYQRNYSDLKGVTDEMSKQMQRIFSEGVEQGRGIIDIADDVVDRIGAIGEARAKLIARTEIIRAYNLSEIREAEQLAIDTEMPVYFEWVTAGDDRVRETHVERSGNFYTKDMALQLIGEPNCRCKLIATPQDFIGEDERIIGIN